MSPQDELDLLRLKRKRAMALQAQQGSATATPPNEEEQRAERVRGSSPEELRKIHFGENVPAGAQAAREADRIPVGEFATGLGAQFSGGTIAGTADLLSKSITEPAQVGKAAAGLLYKSVTEPAQVGKAIASGVGERFQKLSSGTPLESGVAAFDIGSAAIPLGKMAGARVGAAAEEIASHATQRALKQGTNQITAALHPSVRTSKALENTQGDFFQYASKTGRDIIDADSAASVFKDAYDDFYKTKYLPLQREVEKFDPSITQKLDRRAEINDTLGRLGYYDKHPIVQSAARTAPQTDALLAEAEALRKSLNQTVDTMTPTNAGAANILRKVADMRQVSDMTRIKAERINLAKKIKAGEKPTMGERFMDVGKDVAVSAGGAAVGGAIGHVVGGPAGSHIGAAIGTIANPRLIKQMANIKGLKPDADALFARGFENWKKGSGAAAQPIPVKKVPIEFPKKPVGDTPVVGPEEAGAAYGARRQSLGQQQPNLTPDQLDELMRSQSIPGVGQTQMPFAPPGVGAMGSELPNQFDPLQSQISMPNALSQRFSRTPPEQAMPPVTAGESAAAYQARQQSLFEQNPQITPDELAEAMRSQAIPSAGQEFLPFVEAQVGGTPQSLGGIPGTRGPTFPQNYGPPDPRIELLRNAGAGREANALAPNPAQQLWEKSSRVTVDDVMSLIKENEMLRARLQGGQ